MQDLIDRLDAVDATDEGALGEVIDLVSELIRRIGAYERPIPGQEGEAVATAS